MREGFWTLLIWFAWQVLLLASFCRSIFCCPSASREHLLLISWHLFLLTLLPFDVSVSWEAFHRLLLTYLSILLSKHFLSLFFAWRVVLLTPRALDACCSWIALDISFSLHLIVLWLLSLHILFPQHFFLLTFFDSLSLDTSFLHVLLAFDIFWLHFLATPVLSGFSWQVFLLAFLSLDTIFHIFLFFMPFPNVFSLVMLLLVLVQVLVGSFRQDMAGNPDRSWQFWISTMHWIGHHPLLIKHPSTHRQTLPSQPALGLRAFHCEATCALLAHIAADGNEERAIYQFMMIIWQLSDNSCQFVGFMPYPCHQKIEFRWKLTQRWAIPACVWLGFAMVVCQFTLSCPSFVLFYQLEPHKAVAEVSKIGNL